MQILLKSQTLQNPDVSSLPITSNQCGLNAYQYSWQENTFNDFQNFGAAPSWLLANNSHSRATEADLLPFLAL